ncbi:MAG: MFS transporter [candidate division WOR-3 bacterium]
MASGNRALAESEVNRGLRVSVIEGAFATLYTTLAGGMFLAGLALFLGANSFQIALLSAIPTLVTGFSFLSGILVRRAGARKPLVLVTAGIGRSVYVVLVPFLLLGLRVKLPLFLVTVGVSSIMMVIAGTVWTSWISELVPEERRGRFFGLRNGILGITGVTASYLAGRGMDWLKANGHEPLGYGLAFGLAVIFGLLSTLLLTQQPESGPLPRPDLDLREMLFGPLQEPQFRRLTGFLTAWFLTGTLASPFYLVHLIKNLHFSFTAIAIYSMIGGGVGFLFQLFWGRVVDRFGSRPVTVVNFALVGVMPFLWLFATPSFRLPIWLDGVLNGMVWTGASLGLWNLLLDLADNPNRKESYFAIYSVVTGLGAFIASLVAGGVAQMLSGLHLVILGADFYNYDLMFLLAGIARFACLPLLLRIQEPKSKPVRHTIRALGNLAVWRLNAGKDVILEALGLRPKPAEPGE